MQLNQFHEKFNEGNVSKKNLVKTSENERGGRLEKSMLEMCP